jgi:hypothetical protein
MISKSGELHLLSPHPQALSKKPLVDIHKCADWRFLMIEATDHA